MDCKSIRNELSFDGETGSLVWIKTGKPAGWLMRDGYSALQFQGRKVMAHRVIWALHYGSWPRGEIDHINGKKSDNRIANLRDVTRSVNAQNLRSSMPKRSIKAPLGVSWHRGARKWRAMIWDGTKNIYLGLFEDADQAHQAYVKEKRKLHPGCTI